MRKNKEAPRDFYATEEIWSSVYAVATSELRDAMDLAYLTGQHPADVLSMREADAVNDFLQVAQGKTSKKLRIRLTAAGVMNDLGTLVKPLIKQRRTRGVRQFQFRDIRPKAASDILDLGDANRLMGHTDKRITETVYRRVGEIVKPTR